MLVIHDYVVQYLDPGDSSHGYVPSDEVSQSLDIQAWTVESGYFLSNAHNLFPMCMMPLRGP